MENLEKCATKAAAAFHSSLGDSNVHSKSYLTASLPFLAQCLHFSSHIYIYHCCLSNVNPLLHGKSINKKKRKRLYRYFLTEVRKYFIFSSDITNRKYIFYDQPEENAICVSSLCWKANQLCYLKLLQKPHEPPETVDFIPPSSFCFLCILYFNKMFIFKVIFNDTVLQDWREQKFYTCSLSHTQRNFWRPVKGQVKSRFTITQ